LQNVDLNNSPSPRGRRLGGGGSVEAMLSNFTPTPALPHHEGGRKNLQFF
jgi:hypothetical protein